MSHILQLNPPLPVVTPKGRGVAHFVIDYGYEHDLMWVVFIDETRECWTYSNLHIRADQNITGDRPKTNGNGKKKNNGNI